MKDRYLLGSLAAGFAALATGITARALGSPNLGLLAGGLGFLAAVGAVALAARERGTDRALDERTMERNEARGDLMSLTTILSVEADSDSGRAPRDYLEPVIEGSTGLLDPQFFAVLVHQRVAAARRHLQPLSIIIFDIDELDGRDSDARDNAVIGLGRTITQTLRESDAACRMGPTTAAAILEDTAEHGAVWAAERIRGTLHQTSLGDVITVSAGIACYPTHALNADELIAQAERALALAQARGNERLEVATSE